MFVFIFFFWWHINPHGLFNAKGTIVERQQWYYLILSCGDKEVHIFPKGISPRVNIIARLEFELSHYDIAV